jgi:hypothetical protein
MKRSNGWFLVSDVFSIYWSKKKARNKTEAWEKVFEEKQLIKRGWDTKNGLSSAGFIGLCDLYGATASNRYSEGVCQNCPVSLYTGCNYSECVHIPISVKLKLLHKIHELDTLGVI